MFFLPAALLALAAVQVTSAPLDKPSCTPSHLTTILGPTYPNSMPIHNYCAHLFHKESPSTSAQKPSLPLEVSPTATALDVRAACECIIALPPVPAAQQEQQMQNMATALLFPPKENNQVKLAVGGGAREAFQPYGRGALPAPLGSELKGFGARDNLYVRGGNIDGARDRGA